MSFSFRNSPHRFKGILAGGYSGLSWAVDALLISLVLTAVSVLYLLALTAGVGMSSFLAWYSSIDAIGPARALGLNITYSAWGVILSLLFLNQPFHLSVFAGSLLVLLGVCYAMLPASKSSSSSINQ